MSSAAAVKLKGEFGFISGHFVDRHGRSFLGALTRRQYSGAQSTKLNDDLRGGDFPPELVIAGGSGPDTRDKNDTAVLRVGWTCFSQRARGKE